MTDETGPMPFMSGSGEEINISSLKDSMQEETPEITSFPESTEDGMNISALREMETSEETEDDTNDTEETDDEAPESPEAESTEVKEPDAPELLETVEADGFKKKDLSFSLDGEAVKVSNHAIIEIPVDGGIKKLPLQELINRASGDMSVEKRIDEVEKTRQEQAKTYRDHTKQWEDRTAQIEEHNAKLASVLKSAEEGNIDETLLSLGMLAGDNGVNLVEGFINGLAEQGLISKEALEADGGLWKKTYGLELRQRRLDAQEAAQGRKDEAVKEDVTRTELFNKVEVRLKEANVTQEEFAAKALALEKSKGFQSANPEARLGETLSHVHADRVTQAALNIDPALAQDRNLLVKVYNATLNTQNLRTVDKLEEVIRQVKGEVLEEETQRIAKNLSKKARNGTSQQASQASDKEDFGPMSILDHRKRSYNF